MTSPSPSPPPPPPLELYYEEEQSRSLKRQKTESYPEQPAKPEEPDQIDGALARIGTFIGNPRKFVKAAGLLRQLLASGQVAQRHRPGLFEVLVTSMADPETVASPDLAREYSKLFTAASKSRELFGAGEQSQLDVYGLWTVLRWQLATDDSFTFNKALSNIKDSISHLPDAGAEDDSALAAAKEAQQAQALLSAGAGKAAAGGPVTSEGQGEGAPATQPPPEAAPEAGLGAAGPQEPADPFGLETLLQPAPLPSAAQVAVWSAPQCLAMKRQALLDCIQAAQERYSQAWARTSVDLAIQFVREHRQKFCTVHQEHIEELWRFVQQQRLSRKMGPSARERKRDAHGFDAARAVYSKIHISNKAAVGASHDHRNEVWLG